MEKFIYLGGGGWDGLVVGDRGHRKDACARVVAGVTRKSRNPEFTLERERL